MNLLSRICKYFPLFLFGMSTAAFGHDPIFGLGPHVIYKGGVEVAPEIKIAKQGNESETELGFEIVYGITGDWAAGMELPYVLKNDGGVSASGIGDANAFTKYRFWRKDTLGVQESAAVLLNVKFATGSNSSMPALGSGATDNIVGLAYGYEGRKWYRWASVRYRANGRDSSGLKRGDKLLLDIAGGIRTKLTSYREPDTVWILELNYESGQPADMNGSIVADSGGSEAFISPGIFWTHRNFAIKAGVQIPVYSALNGTQSATNYRVKTVFEWHL